VTRASLLDGRVAYEQRTDGHRTGIEPVLLAASVPARAGMRVLEAGTGAGAGLLCLTARVPGVLAVGVERDPALAELARANAAANGFADLTTETADIADFRPGAVFHHAFANPPWHEARASASPDARREAAKRAEDGLLTLWVARLATALRHRGTLTLALPAARLAEALAAGTEAGCGSASVFPLWPHAGEAARLMLLRMVQGGRGPCRILPGLVLHEADGSFTPACDAVLRGGARLAF
jgi:tRNA1(Val) A37 N6-methylase TrmN6